MNLPTLPTLPALVDGTVSHTRKGPLRHDFRHRTYQWLVDLDNIPEQPWYLKGFASLHARDHLGDPDRSIKANVQTYLAASGIDLGPRGRILMLANARVLGHVFDPLTVFWCFDTAGTLSCVLAEVHNTYGERHAYLLHPDASGTAHTAKQLYVSPFYDVSGDYALRFTLNPDRVAVTVTLRRDGQTAFSATFGGRPRPATRRSLKALVIRRPLMPQQVSALIRIHAIWLWVRRLPVVPRPQHSPQEGVRCPPLGVPDPGPQGSPCRNRCPRHLRSGCQPGPGARDDTKRPAFGGSAVEPTAPEFEIIRPRAFFARLGADTKIGLGEGYMAGDWRAGVGTDLADLLTPFSARLATLVPRPLQRLRALVDKRIPSTQENSLEGSHANIQAHYDLSNDLFAQFLDPSMSYSSAWFDTDHPDVLEDLQAAQLRKIDGVLDYASVTEGIRVLEIGTGWGALAVRAAQRGANVTSVTLSREQLALAQERVAEASLAGRVDLRLQDYREVEGQYDAIVSVEMLEAVGEQYWPTYFSAIDRLLAPGGKVSIQAITMSHERMLATRRSFSWIQKYIFPGGIIPSLQAIDESLAQHTTLRVSHRRELGPHYAQTLKQWRTRFLDNWPQVQALGFDETFRRMWEFYLAYCEAGFRTGYLGVSQLQLTREPTWSATASSSS